MGGGSVYDDDDEDVRRRYFLNVMYTEFNDIPLIKDYVVLLSYGHVLLKSTLGAVLVQPHLSHTRVVDDESDKAAQESKANSIVPICIF